MVEITSGIHLNAQFDIKHQSFHFPGFLLPKAIHLLKQERREYKERYLMCVLHLLHSEFYPI